LVNFDNLDWLAPGFILAHEDPQAVTFCGLWAAIENDTDMRRLIPPWLLVGTIAPSVQPYKTSFGNWSGLHEIK
jgi:hypothetical protein